MHRKLILAALAAAALIAAGPAARADQYVQFTLDDVSLENGGTVTGTFDFDTTLDAAGQCFTESGTVACLSAIDITATESGQSVSFTIGRTNSAGLGGIEDAFGFADTALDNLGFSITAASFSTTSSDTLTANFGSIDGTISDKITGGSIDPTPLAIPEPASLPLVASLLAGFGVLWYRRRPRPSLRRNAPGAAA